MNFAHVKCDCGTWLQWGTPYCERCGNQPPTARGRNAIPEVPEEEAAEVIAACVALNEALAWNHCRWAIA